MINKSYHSQGVAFLLAKIVESRRLHATKNAALPTDAQLILVGLNLACFNATSVERVRSHNTKVSGRIPASP